MVGQHLDDLTLEEPLLYAAQNLAVRISPCRRTNAARWASVRLRN